MFRQDWGQPLPPSPKQIKKYLPKININKKNNKNQTPLTFLLIILQNHTYYEETSQCQVDKSQFLITLDTNKGISKNNFDSFTNFIYLLRNYFKMYI